MPVGWAARPWARRSEIFYHLGGFKHHKRKILEKFARCAHQRDTTHRSAQWKTPRYARSLILEEAIGPESAAAASHERCAVALGALDSNGSAAIM